MSMTLIEHIEVGSGGAAELEFTAIPQTFTDLYLLVSARTTTGGDSNIIRLDMTFNNATANRSSRVLYGYGATTASTSSSELSWHYGVPAGATASTFANNAYYITNYTASQNKSVSIDSVTEQNSASAIKSIVAGLWSDTAAITSIQIFDDAGTADFVQYSSATLYGITAGSSGGVTVS